MLQVQDLPPAIQWAQQQLSQYGRIGATRIYKTPDLSAAVPVLGGANVVPAPLLTFRDVGTVIAMYGQERAGTQAKFATTDVRVQFGNNDDLITNGSAGDFMPMLGLFGPNLNWYPLTRRVAINENWQITYRNMDAGATATPTVAFAFIADADLGRVEADYRQAQAQQIGKR
jgi:hypothetical protein